jgi:AcrR family transcriptional regulator
MKNKEETKRKLIKAVGEILKAEGYAKLGVNNIARQAGVNKKLIYRYFGTVDYLIEAYVVENDYWMTFSENLKSLVLNNTYPDTQSLITAILQNQFLYFFSEVEMQRLILWEISTESPLMKSIHSARETMGQQFLQMTDPHFDGSKVNFRSIAALLVGGIYYTVLHSRFNGGMFADININEQNGREQILISINQILNWAFSEAANKTI